MNFLYVFIGGGLGAMARFSVSKIFNSNPDGFPYATFIANFISCIILGYLLSKLIDKELSTNLQLLLITGFCGGFSTFSTFSAESFKLIQNNQPGLAVVYIAASVMFCIACIYLGLKLGKVI